MGAGFHRVTRGGGSDLGHDSLKWKLFYFPSRSFLCPLSFTQGLRRVRDVPDRPGTRALQDRDSRLQGQPPLPSPYVDPTPSAPSGPSSAPVSAPPQDVTASPLSGSVSSSPVRRGSSLPIPSAPDPGRPECLVVTRSLRHHSAHVSTGRPSRMDDLVHVYREERTFLKRTSSQRTHGLS